MTRRDRLAPRARAPSRAAGERSLPHVPPPPRGAPHGARGLHLAHREQPHLRQPRPRASLPLRRRIQDPGGVGAELVTAMTLISSERLYTGRIVSLDVDTVRFPDGSTGQLEMLRHPGASAVVPFLDDPGDARPPRPADPAVPPRGGGLHLGGAGRPARSGGVAGDLRPARAGGGDRHARRRARAAHHHLHHPGLHRRADPPVPRARTGGGGRIAARPTSSWSCTRSGGRGWGRWCGAGRSRTGRR